jgi:hypothetical protein
MVLVFIDVLWPDLAAEYGFGGAWHPAAIAMAICLAIYVVCRFAERR